MTDHNQADRAFFGRRKTKALRQNQSSLMDSLLPRLALPVEAPPPADLKVLFPHPVTQVTLEIGFGGGEHLIREAMAYPDQGFIGVEPFVNGMAKALAEIERKGLTNIRLYFGDAANLFDWFSPQCLACIYLLYPDPWPKTRHHKRRFVQDWTIAKLAKLLPSGGEFRYATDIPGYAEWTLEHLARNPDFTLVSDTPEAQATPWTGWQSTRYEAKALREGRVPGYYTFRRN